MLKPEHVLCTVVSGLNDLANAHGRSSAGQGSGYSSLISRRWIPRHQVAVSCTYTSGTSGENQKRLRRSAHGVDESEITFGDAHVPAIAFNKTPEQTKGNNGKTSLLSAIPEP